MSGQACFEGAINQLVQVSACVHILKPTMANADRLCDPGGQGLAKGKLQELTCSVLVPGTVLLRYVPGTSTGV